MSSGDWLLLIQGTIAALATAIVFIVLGLRKKLEVVHKDTNGNLHAVKGELAFVRSELRRKER